MKQWLPEEALTYSNELVVCIFCTRKCRRRDASSIELSAVLLTPHFGVKALGN